MTEICVPFSSTSFHRSGEYMKYSRCCCMDKVAIRLSGTKRMVYPLSDTCNFCFSINTIVCFNMYP